MLRKNEMTKFEIVLTSEHEANEVLQTMKNILEKYLTVTVSDLMELIDMSSAITFRDERFGWTDLTGAKVEPVKDGYLVNLPPAQSIRV